MVWREAVGAVGLAIMLLGCIAPPATIGSVDQDIGVTSSVVGSSTGTMGGDSGTGASSGASEETSSTTTPVGCDRECVTFYDCQQARCIGGECVVSFRDALCEPGQECGPAGCEATPLPCGDADVFVCEDFEGDAFSSQWAGGSLLRSSTQVNSGEMAGAVELDPDSRQQLQLDLDPPLDEGMLAVRAFVWMPSASEVETWAILFEITGQSNAGMERSSVDLRPDAGLMYVNLLSGNSTVFGNELLTPGTWACVEARVTLSNDAGEVELRVNDVPVLTNGPGIDTIPVDGVANINIGGVTSDNHTGLTTYFIDDIVIARAPIGCAVD
ncbi:MAG: hypothetical protein KUG77_14925 [Nannocystaceae bacterium]|nr:hypothetical protein [Nannocystaceae bacterium]